MPAWVSGEGGVAAEIDVLVLQGSPESFDEDVIGGAALAVHADGDALSFEDARAIGARELGALVGVEDLRPSVVARGVLQGVHAEIDGHGVRQAPGKDGAGVPVDDGDHVPPAALERDVRDVGGPDLVRSSDVQPSQQVGVDLVLRMRPARVWSRDKGLESHHPHQALHALPVHVVTPPTKLQDDLPAAVERPLREDLVVLRGSRCGTASWYP